MSKTLCRYAAWLSLCASVPVLAELPEADYFNAYMEGNEVERSNTEQTELALYTLLSMANQPIPADSSCQGNFGQKGRAKILDLLVSRLSGQFHGKNNLFGLCEKDSPHRRCTLFVLHADGEAVAGAQISILIKNGKPDVNTLSCVMD